MGRYQVSFSTTQDFLPVFYVSLSGTFAAFKFEFYFVGCTCVADGCSMLQPFLWLFQSTRDQTPSLFGLILFAFPLARFGTCFARMFQCVLQICNTKVSHQSCPPWSARVRSKHRFLLVGPSSMPRLCQSFCMTRSSSFAMTASLVM